MPITGEYEPSIWQPVADQVAEYEASGGQRGNTAGPDNAPVVIMTMVGAKSGKVRKAPVMRVEHDGDYALVASKAGAPEHPDWYRNIVASPQIMIQDGPTVHDFTVHEATGAERELWWERAVAAFPPYADYAKGTDREIPVLVARRTPSASS